MKQGAFTIFFKQYHTIVTARLCEVFVGNSCSPGNGGGTNSNVFMASLLAKCILCLKDSLVLLGVARLDFVRLSILPIDQGGQQGLC